MFWYAFFYLAITLLICGLIKLQFGCRLLGIYLKILYRLEREVATVTRIYPDLHLGFEINTKDSKLSGKTEVLAHELGYIEHSLFDVDVIGKMFRFGYEVGKPVIVYVDKKQPSTVYLSRTPPRQIAQCLLTGMVLLSTSWWLLTELF